MFRLNPAHGALTATARTGIGCVAGRSPLCGLVRALVG